MCKKWTLYTELQVKIKALFSLSLFAQETHILLEATGMTIRRETSSSTTVIALLAHFTVRVVHSTSNLYIFVLNYKKKRENVGTFPCQGSPLPNLFGNFGPISPPPPKVADKVVDMVADEKEKGKKGHAKKKKKGYPIWWESWSRGLVNRVQFYFTRLACLLSFASYLFNSWELY